MRFLAASALALSLLASPLAAQTKAGDIAITDPWTRATKGPVGAGFLTLTNTGAAEDTLTKVEAAWAERAEIHDHIRDEAGVMKMRKIEALAVPAGAAVELRPMGKHLMFFGVKEALAEGQSRKVTMTFAKAGPVTIDLPVAAPGSMGPGRSMEGMQHDHGGHDHGAMMKDGKPQRGTALPPPGGMN